jgi:hypothetical protein
MSLFVDHAAKAVALRQWALPECLHVPIAAVDEAAIRNYIGEIDQVLVDGSPPKAFIVKIGEPPPIDPQLPIWDLASSRAFYLPRQVWVHIAFTRYRSAYKRAFPEEAIEDKVLSHMMNRRIAALKGFGYVRLTPTSRGCNSSSSFSENWGVTFHGTLEQIEATRKRARSFNMPTYAISW